MRSDTLYCSFCGKSQHQVRKLIAGPGIVFICNECVDLCHVIVHPQPKAPAPEPELKLCKDCRWAKHDDYGELRIKQPQWICHHADATYLPEPDYVTGETEQPQHTSCHGMRKGICGAQGKLWEPQDEAGKFGSVIGFGEVLAEPEQGDG
jgi:hypothetical protein